MKKNELEAVLEGNIETPELKEVAIQGTRKSAPSNTKYTEESAPFVNCLRNERVIIRHIPKPSGMVQNPKHVLFGGMAENATKTFVVPKLTSGMFVNVLTDNEKKCLEEIMGLEYNALSIYKKIDNFWDDSNENGISRVRLHKQDNYLNLNDPEDYIRYKILLANKNFIASSLQELEDHPKATYQFVIVSEGEETQSALKNMRAKDKCLMEFGKISEDANTLRTIIELIDGRPIAKSTKLDFLQLKARDLIDSQSKHFLKVISDPLLSTKVLIRNAAEAGIIQNRDNHYLYKGIPLCGDNEESTLNNAAIYLNLPKNQELKFSIEAKLK